MSRVTLKMTTDYYNILLYITTITIINDLFQYQATRKQQNYEDIISCISDKVKLNI